VKRAVAVAVTVAVIVAGAGAWWMRSADERQPQDVARPSLIGQVAPATPSPVSTSCDQVSEAFDPHSVTVPGVTTRASVVTPPRDHEGVPGVPPLTSAGKSVFAWDREQGIRPGDAAGNVLLNAHTWPDGTALGNRLLARLHRGDRVVVFGTKARLCYRVTERVEVRADQGMPRYYTTDGAPQLAILVCSGRRLGPGVWEKRTVWFASPSV
jgi:hypothetical protein